MSNPMKRRKLHRAALTAGGKVKEPPVAVPVTPPVVPAAAEEDLPVLSKREARKLAQAAEGLKREEGK